MNQRESNTEDLGDVGETRTDFNDGLDVYDSESERVYWEALAMHQQSMEEFMLCGYTEEEALDTIDQVARDFGQEGWCP